MDFKLLFLSLATLAVVMVTGKEDSGDMNRRLPDVLQMRPSGEKADCIKKCQSDCNGSDHNCCYWPGMNRRAKCRIFDVTNGIRRYNCVHPDLRYANVNGEIKLIHNDCNSIG